MALISISFDTVAKTVAAAIDGTPVPDVVGCRIGPSYCEDDEFRCELTQARKDEANDLTVVTVVMAAADGTLSPEPPPQAAAAALAAELDGYFRRGGG